MQNAHLSIWRGSNQKFVLINLFRKNIIYNFH